MPRGHKKPANPHNSRHENGVVAPGKPVAKQKSNGHLNGSSGRSTPSTPPLPSPSPSPSTFNLTDHEADGVKSSDGYALGELAGGIQGAHSQNIGAVSESQPSGTTTMEMHQPRKIDVNAARNPAVHDNSALNLTLTILQKSPLGDTITILIFLLSLPSTLLTFTNALFAVLTFVASAGSFVSIPSTFNDIFQGSGGAPSLATICITDAIGLMFWLVIWTPAQVLALEFAQAIVATTLGGGYSSKKGGSDSTFLCMFVVFAMHVFRHDWIPRTIFGYNWYTKVAEFYEFSTSSPVLPPDDLSASRSPAGWFRVLVTLHILIQGLVHMARRWYTKREYAQPTLLSKRSDPEAVAGSQGQMEAFPLTEFTPNAPVVSLAEPPSKTSIAALRDTREKVSSGKKKRKQGNYVRSQQPLWAAFATTKVHVLREYEQSHATAQAIGSDAVDAKNLGNAAFASEPGRIWVTLVQPNGFFFDTSHIPLQERSEPVSEALPTKFLGAVNRSLPFYVRINGADWTSTKIGRPPEDACIEESTNQRWTGEVYGLTPSSTYHCAFVRSEDDVVMHSASISTPSSFAIEKGKLVPLPFVKQTNFLAEPSALTTPVHHPHRPSSPTSPTTTLRNSIMAFEASLNESHARQKKCKRDAKGALSALRREIEILQARISKTEGEDKSQQNRHMQWSQQHRQADDAIVAITEEIESLGTIPDQDSQQWKAKKRSFEQAKDQLSAAQDDLTRSKESAQQEYATVQAEATAAQQKRERLCARDSKLNDQYSGLESATRHDFSQKKRKSADQSAKELDRQRRSTICRETTVSITKSIQEQQYLYQQVVQQAQALENAFNQQHLHETSNANGRPLTPEGDLPGTHPPFQATSAFRFPAFGTLETSNHVAPSPQDGRTRSISMHSGHSGYSDFYDDPAPPMPLTRAIEAVKQRPHSGSNASGHYSTPGSQRDTASPQVGFGPTGCARESSVWN